VPTRFYAAAEKLVAAHRAAHEAKATPEGSRRHAPGESGPRVKRPPTRTCLGCRRARPQAMLVRLVRLPNGIVARGLRGASRGTGRVRVSRRRVRRARAEPGTARPRVQEASEAGPDLAAVVRAAGQREAAVPATVASPEVAWLCEVGASAIGDVDVITVRA